MIAICARRGSFTDRWISECERQGLSHVIVDMLSPHLMDTLKEHKVRTLLAHPPMYDHSISLAAFAVIRACEMAGLVVFPSSYDYWHFDDKIAQAYLFDALDIDAPKTVVFYSRDNALSWLSTAEFPVVFKLKSGAGSINVQLVRNQLDGRKIVHRMFGRGCPATSSATKDLSTKIRKRKTGGDWFGAVSRAPATLRKMWGLRRAIDWERGYVLFQEFIPNNTCDIRVTVIGARAFAFKRLVRPGDFRASGSGVVIYDHAAIDVKFIEAAFDLSVTLKTKCVAFDFIERTTSPHPVLVEMSFAFKPEVVFDCGGYWSPDLVWMPGNVWPQDVILSDVTHACGSLSR